ASAVTGAIYGSAGGWPGPAEVAKAFLACWLIMGLWTALGALLAVLFKQAPLAIGLGIVYSIAIEGLIVNTLPLDSSLKHGPHRQSGERRHDRPHEGGRHEGHCHLALEPAQEEREVERQRHAVGQRAAAAGELGGDLEQLLHPEGRLHLDPHASEPVAGVDE